MNSFFFTQSSSLDMFYNLMLAMRKFISLEKIGRPFLWNTLVADRRVYFRKKYAYDQDYRPRFSHERMLTILQVVLKQIENFFNEIQPNFIVSFQCVTPV